MASITQPRESSARAKSPSLGIITFNAKEGKFSVYFQAVYDDNGNVVKDSFNAPINDPKFMVVSVGFFRIVGGKPDRKDRSKFVGVSSPIVCSDKGYKWGQLIPVWVGNESKTPDFYDTWTNLKEKIESKRGRYAEILFVVAANFPDKLLLFELTGHSISQLKDAVKLATGSNYTSGLVEGVHTLEMVNTDMYEIDERNFYKPVFQAKPFNQQSKGYATMAPTLFEFSRQVDAYSDELAAKQKSGDIDPNDGQAETTPLPNPESRLPSKEPGGGNSEPQAGSSRKEPEPEPEPEPKPQAETAPNYDDLPF